MEEEENDEEEDEEEDESDDESSESVDDSIKDDDERDFVNEKSTEKDLDGEVAESGGSGDDIEGEDSDDEIKKDGSSVNEDLSGGRIEEIESRENNQIKWAVILMISLIAIVLLVPPFVKYYFNTFEYIGLEFQKTKLGDLVFYSTRFPVIGVQGRVIGSYAVNFRNDPRELEYIDVDIEDDEIKFIQIAKKGIAPVYISLDPLMEICEDSGIALMNLAGFLKDSGISEVKSAVSDKTYAEEKDELYAVCDESRLASTIIMVKEGEETAIKEIGKSCYEMSFKDCEILQVSEKFMLVILKEYASRFVEGDEEETDKLKKIIEESSKKEGEEVERRYVNKSGVETIINIKTLPEHYVTIKTLDPSPKEGESNVWEYFGKKSRDDGEVSVVSYVDESLIDIVVILEKDGERVEVNGKILHTFKGKGTGDVIDLEIRVVEEVSETDGVEKET